MSLTVIILLSQKKSSDFDQAMFNEYTSYLEIENFLKTNSTKDLYIHPFVLGFTNSQDKRKYNGVYKNLSTIATALKDTQGKQVYALFIEGRVGKQVAIQQVQQSHCNVIIVNKTSNSILVYNPSKHSRNKYSRVANISDPYLTRLILRRIPTNKSNGNYKYFFISGKQTNDVLCRNYCKEFILNWKSWTTMDHVQISK